MDEAVPSRTASAPVAAPTHGLPGGAVVVGLDGSPASWHALDWAVTHVLAHAADGGPVLPLVLVHATGRAEGAGSWLPAESPLAVRLLVQHRRHGQELLDRASSSVRSRAAGIAVHTTVPERDPRVALLELARDAGLVVLGDRGASGLDDLPVGAVGAAVPGLAACPVVVVRATDHPVPRPSVVVGVDAAAASAPAVELAYREAAARRLPLVLLSAMPVAGHADEARERLLGTRRAMADKFPDVVVSLELAVGTPASALLRAADRAVLVVVGRGTTGGALAAVVAEQAKVPVAVVPVAGPPGARP